MVVYNAQQEILGVRSLNLTTSETYINFNTFSLVPAGVAVPQVPQMACHRSL